MAGKVGAKARAAAAAAKSEKANQTVLCTPNSVPTIPKDWAIIGAKTGYDPKPAEALRFWNVGPSGEGKTTFLSSIPDNIILDFDDGASSCPGGRATRIYVESYDHYVQITDKLIAEGKAGNRNWRRVSFDTADEWAGMIINQLQEEKGVEDITEFGSAGHGWNMIKSRCWNRLRAIEEAGYTWACNGHLQTKDEYDPITKKAKTVLRDSLFPSFSRKITTRADFKLTIYCKQVSKTITGPTRRTAGGRKISGKKEKTVTNVYFCNSMSTEEKKNKGRGAPEMDRKFEVPLVRGWDVFKAKYDEAVEAAREKFHSTKE
jgi:hypothetical protein